MATAPITPHIKHLIPAGPKPGTDFNIGYNKPPIQNLTYEVMKDPETNEVTYHQVMSTETNGVKKYGSMVKDLNLEVTCLGDIKVLAGQPGTPGKMASTVMKAYVFGQGSTTSFTPSSDQVADIKKALGATITGNITSVTRQLDGKTLISGTFRITKSGLSYPGVVQKRWVQVFDNFQRDYVPLLMDISFAVTWQNLARLNSNGTVDTSFIDASTLQQQALTIQVHTNNLIYTNKANVLYGPDATVSSVIYKQNINEPPTYGVRGAFHLFVLGQNSSSRTCNEYYQIKTQQNAHPAIIVENQPNQDAFDLLYPMDEEGQIKAPGGFPGLRVVPCSSKVQNGKSYCEPVLNEQVDYLKTLNDSVYWEQIMTGGVAPTTPRKVFSSIKPKCKESTGFVGVKALDLMNNSLVEEKYQLKFTGDGGDVWGKQLWHAAVGDSITFIPRRLKTRIVFNDTSLNEDPNYKTKVIRNIDVYKITAAQSSDNNTVVNGVNMWKSIGSSDNLTLNLDFKLQYEVWNANAKIIQWKDMPNQKLRILADNGYSGELNTNGKWNYDTFNSGSGANINNLQIDFGGSQFLLPSANSIEIIFKKYTKLPTRIKFNKIDNYYMGGQNEAASLANTPTSQLKDLVGDGKIDLTTTLEVMSLANKSWQTLSGQNNNILVYTSVNRNFILANTNSINLIDVDPLNKLIANRQLKLIAEFKPLVGDQVYSECFTTDKMTWNRIPAGDSSRLYKTVSHGDVTPVTIRKVNNYKVVELTSCSSKTGWSLELGKVQDPFTKPETLFPLAKTQKVDSLTGSPNKFEPMSLSIPLKSAQYDLTKLNYVAPETAKQGYFRGYFNKSVLTTGVNQNLQLTQACSKLAFKTKMPGNIPLTVLNAKAKPPTVASSLGFNDTYFLKCVIAEEPIIRQQTATPAGASHPMISKKEIPINVRVWIDETKNIITN